MPITGLACSVLILVIKERVIPYRNYEPDSSVVS